MPRDVIHFIPGQYGDFAGRNLEWHGDGLAEYRDGRPPDHGDDLRRVVGRILAVSLRRRLDEYLEDRAKWPFEPAIPTPTPHTKP